MAPSVSGRGAPSEGGRGQWASRLVPFRAVFVSAGDKSIMTGVLEVEVEGHAPPPEPRGDPEEPARFATKLQLREVERELEMLGAQVRGLDLKVKEALAANDVGGPPGPKERTWMCCSKRTTRYRVHASHTASGSFMQLSEWTVPPAPQ